MNDFMNEIALPNKAKSSSSSESAAESAATGSFGPSVAALAAPVCTINNN